MEALHAFTVGGDMMSYRKARVIVRLFLDDMLEKET